MSIQIQISKDLLLSAEQKRPLRRLLEGSVKTTLKHVCSTAKVDLSLVLCGDEQIRELNQGYRSIDAPTDVLSFSSGETDPETGRLYLGDILISYPRAADQATAGGHSIEAELQLLAVHGALHLCGFDHLDPEDRRLMWEKQAEVLHLLGCPISGPLEESS